MLRIVPMLNPDGVVLGNYRHPFPLIPFPSSFSAAPRPSLSLAPTHTRPLPLPPPLQMWRRGRRPESPVGGAV